MASVSWTRRPGGRRVPPAWRKSNALHPRRGASPARAEPLPDTREHDAAKTPADRWARGLVENVSTEMWNYEVSGKQVVGHWFSYRPPRPATRPQIGDKRPPSPLDKVQPEHWLAEYTSDLIDLLNVIGRAGGGGAKQAELMRAHLLAGEKIEAAKGGGRRLDSGENVEQRVAATRPASCKMHETTQTEPPSPANQLDLFGDAHAGPLRRDAAPVVYRADPDRIRRRAGEADRRGAGGA